MSLVRVFVSFDVDHDNDLKIHLLDQAAENRSLFAVADWSIREVAADWRDKARKRISNVDLVLVICGEHTDAAPNVNNELALAQETDRPYLLLNGRPGRSQKPKAARDGDRVLDWNPGTWREPDRFART